MEAGIGPVGSKAKDFKANRDTYNKGWQKAQSAKHTMERHIRETEKKKIKTPRRSGERKGWEINGKLQHGKSVRYEKVPKGHGVSDIK